MRDFVGWLGRKGETDGRNLLELTQTIALITMLESSDEGGADAVQLSTLHAAKGLEFAHVFMVGVEEGLLPHREAIDAGNVDEERRLMYVGVTRARADVAPVVLPHAQARGRTRRRPPSRFIAELAQEDLRYADTPLSPSEAAAERVAGGERLKSLKAMLAR